MMPYPVSRCFSASLPSHTPEGPFAKAEKMLVDSRENHQFNFEKRLQSRNRLTEFDASITFLPFWRGSSVGRAVD